MRRNLADDRCGSRCSTSSVFGDDIMKNGVKSIAAAVTTVLICLTFFSGCSVFGNSGKTKPSLTTIKEMSGDAKIYKNGAVCEEYAQKGIVELSKGDTASYRNFDFNGVDYTVLAPYVSLSGNGVFGIGIAKLTDAEGNSETVRAVFDTAGKIAQIVAYSESGSRVLLEKEYKGLSFEEPVSLTAEYNKGVISVWANDTYMFGKEYDLGTESGTPSAYADFYSECDGVSFKFIKIYGKIAIMVFDPYEFAEGAENLAAHASWSVGTAKGRELSSCYIKNSGGAFMATLNGVGLKNGEDFYLSYTLKTEKAKKEWYGMRIYLSSKNGERDLAFFSLDYGVYFSGGDKSSEAYRYSRPDNEPEKFVIVRKDGLYYVWLNGEPALSGYKPYEDTSSVTDMFGFHFEFGKEEVSDIFICRPADIEIF